MKKTILFLFVLGLALVLRVPGTQAQQTALVITPGTANISVDSKGGIYWTTNINASCSVGFGQDQTLSGGNASGAMVQAGSSDNDGQFHYYSTITGLTPNVDYFYHIVCNTTDGQNVTSDTKTLPKYVSVIQLVGSGSGVYNSASVTLNTTLAARCSINYTVAGGNEAVKTTDIDTNFSTQHVININGLTANTTYIFSVTCFDQSSNYYYTNALTSSGIDANGNALPTFTTAAATNSGSKTEPTLPAGQDVKSLISSTFGANYLNHIVTNPSSVKSGLILFRVNRDCATGNPTEKSYSQLTNFGPGRWVMGNLQKVYLDQADYYNYTCGSRFQEQCINDGTFDGYYDEVCVTDPAGSTAVTPPTNKTEPTLPAGQDVKSLIASTFGADYLNHIVTNPSTVKSGLILFRVNRDCATGNPTEKSYSQLTNFGPGRWVMGNLQKVYLDQANYYNYTCNSRFQEQCIDDGSFDGYYDEVCATTDGSGTDTSSTATQNATPSPAASIITINDNANQLYSGKTDSLLAQIDQLRNTIAEQASQIKYLATLIKGVPQIPQATLDAINNFITYGVDPNTVKLGAGQRAAVVNSFKSARF